MIFIYRDYPKAFLSNHWNIGCCRKTTVSVVTIHRQKDGQQVLLKKITLIPNSTKQHASGNQTHRSLPWIERQLKTTP